MIKSVKKSTRMTLLNARLTERAGMKMDFLSAAGG